MNHYLHQQYRETQAKFRKFSCRLEKSQEKGEFYRLSRRKQNFLVSRVKKLWEKLRILEVRLKITTVGASMACLLMVSNLSAQDQFVAAPDKNPLPPPTIFGFNPMLTDLDQDGDLDLLLSDYYDTDFYFENTGTVNAPVFVERTGNDHPFSTVPEELDLDLWDIIDIKDIDGDGDMDILTDDNYIIYNVGTNEDPDYSSYTNSSGYLYDAGIADLDGDGDYDVIQVDYGNNVRFFENTGSAAAFVISNEYTLIPVANWNEDVNDVDNVYPADMDGDGDIDLVVGVDVETYDPVTEDYDWWETVTWLRNTGTVNAPAFEMVSEEDNPFSVLDTDEISLGDLDGDGDYDVILMDYNDAGGVQFYELDNGAITQNKDLVPEFHDGVVLPISYYIAPQFVDFDGDGDLDLFVFSYYSNNNVYYYEYQDTQEQLKFYENEARPLEFFDENLDVQVPFFVDLDQDGDIDVIRVSYDYDLEVINYEYLENTGTDASPAYSLQEIPVLSGMENFTQPSFVDIDDDGDMDLFFSGEQYNASTYSWKAVTEYYESTGDDPTEFIKRGGMSNPLWFFNSDNYDEMREMNSLKFSDIDEDGDLDMVTAGYYSILFFENIGSSSSPQFEDKSESGPFAGIQGGYYGQISLADIDGDGDDDLLVHELYGMLTSYYENTGGSGTLVKEREMTGLEVYPNPSAEFLFIRMKEGITNDANYTIFNMNGSDMMQGSIQSHSGEVYRIPLEHLAKGMYFIRIEGEQTHVEKFIKQ